MLFRSLHLRQEGGLRAAIRPGPSTALALLWPWVMMLLPFLVVAAPALLLLRLRLPRPSRRRVFRQPGTAACLAVIVSGSLSVLANIRILMDRFVANPITDYLSRLERLGGSVLLIWLTLALAGFWRPPADWIDRSGRILGVVLIVVYVWSIARFLVR